MAVEVGFEPTEGLPPHTLSRRAPSATRRLHRRRAYPTTGCTPHEAHARSRVLNAACNTLGMSSMAHRCPWGVIYGPSTPRSVVGVAFSTLRGGAMRSRAAR